MIPPHLSEVRKRFVVALQLEPGDRGDSTAQRSLAAGEPDSRCRMPLDTVSTTGSKMPPAAIFGRPTAVILCGRRPLLNWLISALASKTDPEFIWTDVRLRGEVLAEADPLGRGFVSSDRSNVVFPQELAPKRPRRAALPRGECRTKVPPPTVRRLGDFLRLPLHTRGRLAGAPTGGQPIVLALSNARRMVALYPAETVAPVVRPIVEEGAHPLRDLRRRSARGAVRVRDHPTRGRRESPPLEGGDAVGGEGPAGRPASNGRPLSSSRFRAGRRDPRLRVPLRGRSRTRPSAPTHRGTSEGVQLLIGERPLDQHPEGPPLSDLPTCPPKEPHRRVGGGRPEADPLDPEPLEGS